MDEQLMSETRQKEVLAKVEEAAALHMSGMSPTEALAKVASEAGYNEHVLQRMVETFNTAKTLQHMRQAPETEKAASFDLADYDQAHAIMFPDDEQQVKAAYFDQPDPRVFNDLIPNFNKQATDASVLKMAVKEVPRDFARDLRQAFRKVGGYQTKAREFRKQAEEYKFILERTLQELGSSFKRAAHATNWYEFRKEAAVVGGVLAEQLADIVEHQHGLAQRYSRHKLSTAEDWEPDSVIDDTTHEHKLMKVAATAARLCSHFGVQAQRWFQKHASTWEALVCLGKTRSSREKSADVGSSLGLLALQNQMNQATQAVLDRRKTPVITDADLGGDLDISSELQKTRMGIALRDMMEEDEVIAQHAAENPSAVTEAMDQLINVSPELANMPIALRSALRRQLEMGTTEPFELSQLRELSKEPQKYQPNIMTAAPQPMQPRVVT